MNAITSVYRVALTACTLVCIALPSRADPIYHLTVCGGDGPAQPGSACYVQPTGGGNGGVDADKLAEFFNSHGIATPNPLHDGVPEGEQVGLDFGPVFDPDAFINTYFITDNGNVVCCLEDNPFRITGLNSSGTFIGHDGDFPFVGTEFDAFSIFQRLPVLDAESLRSLEDPDFFFPLSWFDAIDDAGRISGSGGRAGAYLLTPDIGEVAGGVSSVVSSVPEPGSLGLLAGALGLLGLFCRSRRRVEA